MKQTISSPLAPCPMPESGRLSSYQALGIVTELAIYHSEYDALNVEQISARLLPALESGQAKVFLDDDSRPYGYASWITLSDEAQQDLLESSDDIEADVVHYFQLLPGPNLWLLDLLCPFASPLTMLRTLKAELHDHNSARLIPHPKAKNMAIRRLW